MVEGLSVTVTVTDNPFQLSLDTLFAMAARMNKKRAFLFVSKVLGKHIPVHPYVALLSGAALSLLLARKLGDESLQDLLAETMDGLAHPERAQDVYTTIVSRRITLPEPVRFIGFAETATALGHSMYTILQDGCTYIHTTRETIPVVDSIIHFDEEHSHAVAHRCYALDPAVIAGKDTIVLVDDEITTGKTALNIIRDIQANYPRAHYIVASLLDWRTPEDEQRFAALEKELGITIELISLLKGTIEVQGSSIASVPQEPSVVGDRTTSSHISFTYLEELFQVVEGHSLNSGGFRNPAPYLQATGRFGIHAADNDRSGQGITAAAAQLKAKRVGGRTLCLGTGEFMYVPMRIAAEMGNEVYYHSTTRSPIHVVNEPHYAITAGFSYVMPDDWGVTNFIYNLTFGQYDDLFLFLERDMPLEHMQPMLDALSCRGFKGLNIVVCGPKIHYRGGGVLSR